MRVSKRASSNTLLTIRFKKRIGSIVRMNETATLRIEKKSKAQFPDMDGKTIYVRSEQEQKMLRINFLKCEIQHEEPYEHPLADEMHSQVIPDFSIYFEQNGKIKRIYLEHFGADEYGLVSTWFAKDKGITYEEANQKYDVNNMGRKQPMRSLGVVFAINSSADFHYSDIRHTLKASLEKAGVPVQEKTDAELNYMIWFFLQTASRKRLSFSLL